MWTSVDGLRVHALATGATPRRGARAAPAIVLLHGLGVSNRYFAPLALALSSRFRVFAPSLPGTGKSDPPARPLELAGLAEALWRWLDAAGIEPACLVGNSMGCQVLAELALRAPRRVERLVFLGPTVDPRWRSLARQIPRWLIEATREPLSLLPTLVRDYLTYGPRRFLATGRFALEDRLEDKLPGIAAPTLVVRGERDGFVSPGWAAEIARRLPRGTAVTLPGAAHAAHYSAPVEVAALVRSFVLD